ncbi:hypothetical protein CCR75_008753 [Bremia lactucae]|uniref:Uncharacterized protein n=1 Tax=Bremia lactucae TaxID=4779 RepID=A0A976IK01_BRELC|nr:hypothetical protein CCR75_008753 [Bremia lactucae]
MVNFCRCLKRCKATMG